MEFNQVNRSRSLTKELADSIRSEIVNGKLKLGSKLPASKDIEKAAGVSRTVVREAVAQLKAEGLLDSKQGVGVFVSDKPPRSGFSIESTEFESIKSAIQILELRMAVEVEMCGMAALNRTDEQMQAVVQALEVMENKMVDGTSSAREDFDFHIAIAKASGNTYFSRFIEYIGHSVIPAREIVTHDQPESEVEEFVQTIQDEHRHITRAIQLQDPELAKAAMRAHLGNSLKRHKNIVDELASN